MHQLVKTLTVAVAAAFLFEMTPVQAQTAGGGGNQRSQANGGNGGRGNRASNDPAQVQQRVMDRYKEALGITDADEWKVIQERILKVVEAQRETRSGGGGMMGGRRGGGTQDGNNQRRGGGPGADTNPAAAALQKALDDNASTETVDAKLSSFRDSRKAAEAKLEAARAALQKIVTRKQEARLVLMGILK